MSDFPYSVEPLGPRHDRAAFSCGVGALNRYFREHAGQDVRRNLATVFVLIDSRTAEVAGYYTLSATGLARTSLPQALTRRLPRYEVFPAVLLGRLAVDTRHQGRGAGRALLYNAMNRVLAQTSEVAAMAFVVDAKGEPARRFYEGHGFERLVDDEWRLFIPMARVANLVSGQ